MNPQLPPKNWRKQQKSRFQIAGNKTRQEQCYNPNMSVQYDTQQLASMPLEDITSILLKEYNISELSSACHQTMSKSTFSGHLDGINFSRRNHLKNRTQFSSFYAVHLSEVTLAEKLVKTQQSQVCRMHCLSTLRLKPRITDFPCGSGFRNDV
jgi:hypothetical protein